MMIARRRTMKEKNDSKKENNEDSKKENNDDIRLDWMPFP